MPPHRPRQTAQGTSSGLISSVFSFVSREIESFVSNAAGKGSEDDEDEDYDDQPEASTSRVRLPDMNLEKKGTKRTGKETRLVGRNPIRQTRVDELVEVPKHRPRASSRRRSPYYSDSGDDGRRRVRRCASSSPMLRSTRRQPASPSKDVEEEEMSGSECSPNPPSGHLFRRCPSITMPGALFDRTSSLEPSPEPEWEKVRVVRFASAIVSPPASRKPGTPSRPVSYSGKPETSPSRSRGCSNSDRQTHDSPSVEYSPEVEHRQRTSQPAKSLLRNRNNKVLDVAQLFSAEDHPDTSLMLPRSPARVQSRPPAPNDKGKGKGRQVYPEGVPDEQWDSDHSQDRGFAGDMSCETRVQGKERELLTAKQKEQKRAAHESEDHVERQRDKERIKALEEELKKLREELAKRPVATQSFFIPPPPPPPPPPPLNISVRPQAGQSTALFAEARASLKHTSTPSEKPINPAAYGGASKRKGQPTINVGADKMAAFLTEMKTHRLRKVGVVPNGSFALPVPPTQPAIRVREVGDVGNRSEVILRPREIDDVGNRSEALLRPGRENRDFMVLIPRGRSNSVGEHVSSMEVQTQMRTGVKRKQLGDGAGATQNSLSFKRRALTTSANLSADSSSVSSNSVPSSSSMNRAGQSSSTLGFARSYPPSYTTSNSRLLSSTRTETDMATPSLCSDNEQDIASFEERSPPTPSPASMRSRSRSISVDGPRKPPLPDLSRSIGRSPEQAKDVDMERYASEQHTDGSRTMSRARETSRGAFARRQQTSPKLLDSPRRPRPPARSKGSKETVRLEQVDVDSDPLSLSHSLSMSVEAPSQTESAEGSAKRMESPPIHLPARPPAGTLKDAPPTRLPIRRTAMASQKSKRPSTRESSYASSAAPTCRRRESLDSELRRAEERLETDIFDDDVQLESVTLAGAGTRSRKQGFLAHGGAGGMPVLMGLDEESQSRRTRSSTAGRGLDKYC